MFQFLVNCQFYNDSWNVQMAKPSKNVSHEIHGKCCETDLDECIIKESD